MAEKNFYVDINLQGNQIKKVRLEALSTDPAGLGTGDEGRMYYNTSTNKIKTWNGASWDITGNDLLHGDVVSTVDGTATIQPGVVDTGKLADTSVTTGKIVNAAVTNVKLASMNANTIKGKISASGTPQDLTPTQVRTMLNVEDGAEVNIATNLDQINNTTTQLELTSSTGNSTTLLGATSLKAGLMTSADKDILDALDSEAVLTIGNTALPTKVTVNLVGSNSTDIALVDGTNSGVMSPGDKSKLDGIDAGATNNPQSQFDLYVLKSTLTGTTWIKTDINLGGNADDEVSTTKAVKAYVDAQLSGQGGYQGQYNAATNTPKLDATPIAGIKKGDYWAVTTEGTFFTTFVTVGTTLIADKDDPTAEADWAIVQRVDNIASETQAGIIEIATQGETNTGTDDERAITPLKLATLISNLPASGMVQRFGQLIGDGAATSFTINHALTQAYVSVTVIDETTKEIVEASVKMSGTNAVIVEFNVAPTSDQFYVLIQG